MQYHQRNELKIVSMGSFQICRSIILHLQTGASATAAMHRKLEYVQHHKSENMGNPLVFRHSQFSMKLMQEYLRNTRSEKGTVTSA